MTHAAGPMVRMLMQIDELRSEFSGGLLDTVRKTEDLMEAFGWDVRSPLQVSRSMNSVDGPVVLAFRIEQEVRLTIDVWPYRQSFGHAAISSFEREVDRWRAITNVEHWQIASPPAAGKKIHAIDIRMKDSDLRLRRLLSRESHLSRIIDHEEPDTLASINLGKEAKPVIWPSRATHFMQRKGCVSFIEYDPATRKTILLAGSLLRAKMGSSFPQHHRLLRERAIAALLLVPEGAFLRAAADLPLESPSAAATQATGTVANGWLCWRDRQGNPIERGP